MTTSDGRLPSIAYLTAGAANMFCGSCLRDNALAAALAKAGYDITLIPTYTPIRTDETSVAVDKVFLGGIAMYLQQKYAFFRWIPRWMDRWMSHPALIRWLASRGGGMETQAAELGAMTVSMLQGERGHQAKEILHLVDWLERQLKPGIINLSNLLIGGAIPTIKRQLNIPIVVTLQGDDLFLDGLAEPYRAQALAELRRVAQDVDAFITFSDYYADAMATLLAVPRDRFYLQAMGIDLADFPETPPEPVREPVLGYFARVCFAKGFHVVVDAFIQLAQRPEWSNLTLRAAGWLGEQDEPYFKEQVAKIAAASLTDRFHYAGAVDRAGKLAFLQSVALLAVPTTYRDPKGLFALEALAMGVPVVLSRHGAFPELLARTGGGVLIDPNDVDGLTATLADLLANPARRVDLGREGHRNVWATHSAAAMAESTAAIYRTVLARRRAGSALDANRVATPV